MLWSAALAAALLAGEARAQLPESKGAPRVGEKAPEFALPDKDGKPVKLAELLPGAGKKYDWLLLIFYRGYW
jgi:hypothetical protein